VGPTLGQRAQRPLGPCPAWTTGRWLRTLTKDRASAEGAVLGSRQYCDFGAKYGCKGHIFMHGVFAQGKEGALMAVGLQQLGRSKRHSLWSHGHQGTPTGKGTKGYVRKRPKVACASIKPWVQLPDPIQGSLEPQRYRPWRLRMGNTEGPSPQTSRTVLPAKCPGCGRAGPSLSPSRGAARARRPLCLPP
jgi:hypothetical protein